MGGVDLQNAPMAGNVHHARDVIRMSKLLQRFDWSSMSEHSELVREKACDGVLEICD